MLSFKDILRTSRPLLWLNTSILWVWGLLVLGIFLTWADVVMIFYFTLPFNLWLHGINDVYDHASDLLNQRKGSDEGALLPRLLHAPMLRATLLWNIPFWLFAIWQGNPLSTLLLAVFLFLGWAYSAPPIRGKSRPFVDSLINVAYIFPYLIALAWHNASGDLWLGSFPAIIAFAGWSIASHAFTSIQDIEADREAGISTVATFLGKSNTTHFALLGYALAIIAAAQYHWQLGIPFLLYVGYVLWYRLDPTRERANRLYRIFIWTNSALGFMVTVGLAFGTPPNTLWAAIVVLSLVAWVVVALAYGRYKPKKISVEHQVGV
jgi:4-hydroxybenzoate polyprenyltransferase